MIKKTIILVIIFLIVINTIYWLYVSIRVFKYDELVEDRNMRWEIIRQRMDKLPKGEEGFSKYMVDKDKLTAKQREEYEQILERMRILGEEFDRSRRGFTNRMVNTFAESDLYTAPFIILAIIDSVLIAISFMIILLYKKD